ncbi:MAG: glycoside hydrolase family 2 protein [Chloroflexi bacterium]|nr:glycoside hydrolase family 2 protein [Chloroflexota bacterium]
MSTLTERVINLNGPWQLKDFEPGEGVTAQTFTPTYPTENWLAAQVPGEVHSSLLAAGLIPEPYYDTNVEQVQWVEQREWWYRRTFEADWGTPGATDRDLLTFDGLDTYATIYLNGLELGRHQNMFRPAVFDVTGKLNYGNPNVLAVRLDPPLLYIDNKSIPGQWGDYNSNQRVFARKTQSHFSWDWAPRLVNMGIWQGVRLERFTTARLSAPYFQTLAITENYARVRLDTGIESWNDTAALTIKATLGRGETVATLEAGVEAGQAGGEIMVENPALWWPNGYGEAALYDLEVTLWQGQTLLDTFRDRVGLRTLSLDRSPDPAEPGTEFFTFVVNGVPIFAKGANWIEADLLNGRITPDRYEELLRLLVDAHGNMLRVWGGGQYEPDAFYRTADELGILIWQDFMFACGLYPDFDPAFVEEVRQEAEFQVQRLRNHPSLALWVGNNENDWVEDSTRWQEVGHDFPGKYLYHELLPEITARRDPSRPYWPSSPYGGNDHNGEQAGDSHNWRVWHGNVEPRHFGEEPQRNWSPEGVSYRHYGEDMTRFASEFGIHALPVLETVRRNVPESELYFGSPGLLFRNKDNPKDKGNMLMQAHTGLPRDLAEYIDFSMITQAEGLKYGIEHFRRRKPHCSGTLVWQWNDCWPGLTWAVLDYYAFPKAGYFFVKRAYEPVLASFKEEPDGSVSLWLTNDTLAPVSETLTWTHATFSGEVLHRGTVQAQVKANSSQEVATIPADLLGQGHHRDEFLWVSGSNPALSNRHFFVEIKDLERDKPGVKVEWEQDSMGGWLAHLSSPQFAYFVHLFLPDENIRYSDNWFDLFPGETKTIRLWRIDSQPFDPEQVETGWR